MLAPLAARGVAVDAAGLGRPRVDWAGYDLVVLRSPWDYAPRRDEFVAWARRCRGWSTRPTWSSWNTDKRYLGELAAAGVPTVPTSWSRRASTWAPPPAPGEYVVKPTVSAGSQDTGRYAAADPRARGRWPPPTSTGCRRPAGRHDPALPGAVDTAGETALLFLAGPDELTSATPSARVPCSMARTWASRGSSGRRTSGPYPHRRRAGGRRAGAGRGTRAVRAAALRTGRPAPGPGRRPVLMEFELTEPSLFLGYADGAPDRLAEAVLTHLPAADRPGRAGGVPRLAPTVYASPAAPADVPEQRTSGGGTPVRPDGCGRPLLGRRRRRRRRWPAAAAHRPQHASVATQHQAGAEHVRADQQRRHVGEVLHVPDQALRQLDREQHQRRPGRGGARRLPAAPDHTATVRPTSRKTRSACTCEIAAGSSPVRAARSSPACGPLPVTTCRRPATAR